MLPWLSSNSPFPPVEKALREPNGLLAAGGDLSVNRLLSAYSQGIFPWFSEGDPILWWSPDPRMVLFPDELVISKSLVKTLRNKDYQVKVDSAFRTVIEACSSKPRDGQAGTWIVPEMIEAYCKFHEAGYGHSFETWMDGALVGGLYGVALGRAFFGESMFMHKTDASKIAFVHLVRQLKQQGFEVIDCQMRTPHLASLGGREIPRAQLSEKLKKLVNYSMPVGKWNLEIDLKEEFSLKNQKDFG